MDVCEELRKRIDECCLQEVKQRKQSLYSSHANVMNGEAVMKMLCKKVMQVTVSDRMMAIVLVFEDHKLRVYI